VSQAESIEIAIKLLRMGLYFGRGPACFAQTEVWFWSWDHILGAPAGPSTTSN